MKMPRERYNISKIVMAAPKTFGYVAIPELRSSLTFFTQWSNGLFTQRWFSVKIAEPGSNDSDNNENEAEEERNPTGFKNAVFYPSGKLFIPSNPQSREEYGCDHAEGLWIDIVSQPRMMERVMESVSRALDWLRWQLRVVVAHREFSRRLNGVDLSTSVSN